MFSQSRLQARSGPNPRSIWLACPQAGNAFFQRAECLAQTLADQLLRFPRLLEHRAHSEKLMGHASVFPGQHRNPGSASIRSQRL